MNNSNKGHIFVLMVLALLSFTKMTSSYWFHLYVLLQGRFLLRLSRIKRPQVMSMVRFGPTALNLGYVGCWHLKGDLGCEVLCALCNGRICSCCGQLRVAKGGEINLMLQKKMKGSWERLLQNSVECGSNDPRDRNFGHVWQLTLCVVL